MVDDAYSTIGLRDASELANEWIVPLSEGDKKLGEVLAEMEPWKLRGADVPFVIKFFENPKFNFFNLFPGSVRLKNHDCIHAILGRGILPKDEAFVIGFTMGSTKKFGRFREWLFLLIARYLYPDGYKFYKEEKQIFKSAVEISSRMNCIDLTKVDFNDYLNHNLRKLRRKLGICERKLKLRYIMEKELYKDSIESQRLL